MKLYEEARALINDRDYEGALKIAKKLHKLRFSGAFEIEALAYSALGRHEDAVRVLREGLELAPSVWLNWQLLGNCLSDLGRFDEAMDAYDRADACPRVDRASLNLNRAIVAERREDHVAALQYLDGIELDEAETQLRASSVRIGALHGLGRDAEAEELGSRVLAERADKPNKDIAEIVCELGEIKLARGEDREALWSWVAETWRATHHERLLWLLRELRPRRSPDAQYFRLVVHCVISPKKGYYRSVHAVADCAEEALALLQEIEPEDDLRIEEAEVAEPRPNGPKGVYAAMGRVYYDET